MLQRTPEMLPVLKEAGVVDSGGQGLVTVLEGAFDAFLGKEIDLTFDAQTAPEAELPGFPLRQKRIFALDTVRNLLLC